MSDELLAILPVLSIGLGTLLGLAAIGVVSIVGKVRARRRKKPWTRSVTDPIPSHAPNRIVTRKAAEGHTIIRRVRIQRQRRI